jgi:UDP-GlcNAc:undecaprenyl-phosphate/decaprenyl-phosphate GlcNAc-1-phosphate transferase
MLFLSTLLLSMFITLTLIPVLRRAAIRVNAIDFPDARKVHDHPMPKSGGIAMALGAFIPIVLWAPGDPFVKAVLLGGVTVTFFGAIDDFRNLGYKAKFLGQAIAAMIVIFYGDVKIECLGAFLPDGCIISSWIAIPLTLIVIVGVTNAINLSDGLDGLAGGITLLSFICVAYLAYRAEHPVVGILAVAVAGAIFGFLRFNTYPAILFMGDAGSQLLGFLAVTLSVKLTQVSAPLSPLLPLLLLGFPILDTMTVMLERIREGKSPFVADKNHFHHRLMRLGLFHTEAVLVIYIIQTSMVAAAFILRFYSDWVILAFYALFSGLILLAFVTADRAHWTFKRTTVVDKVLKRRLKVLKDKQVFIKVCFGIVEYGLPFILLFACFVPVAIPVSVSVFASGLLGLLLLTWFFKREWIGGSIRVALYLFIPVILYLSERNAVPWMNDEGLHFYDLSFGAVVVFVILTLKLTRRQKGFKTTPMDFLILFVALVVPNLPDDQIRSYQMGLFAAKIVVMFFGYEVLMGELRGKWGKLTWFTVGALAVCSVRGLA